VPVSSSASLYSGSGPIDEALDWGREVEALRVSLSDSDGDPSLDFVLLESFLLLDDREAKNDSSSVVETVVAAVEFERRDDFMLSMVVVVCVYIDDRLVVDLDRFLRAPFIDPAKKSLTDPGRPLKRFRESASSPKIATFVRAVGVEGREFLPVLNSNNPN